jgi:hypothetical protein
MCTLQGMTVTFASLASGWLNIRVCVRVHARARARARVRVHVRAFAGRSMHVA